MRKSKFKFMDKEEKNVEMVHLSPYMKSVIERLTADKKRPAVHTYNATLNSFTKFSGGQGTEEMLVTDVFTAGKLKEYEAWLRSGDTRSIYRPLACPSKAEQATSSFLSNRCVCIARLPFGPTFT